MLSIQDICQELKQGQLSQTKETTSTEPLVFFEQYAHEPYACLLLSSQHRSILARDPLLVLKGKGMQLTLEFGQNPTLYQDGNPFDLLPTIQASLPQPSIASHGDRFPFLGYLGYEAKKYFYPREEALNTSKQDIYQLPDLYLVLFSELWIFDPLRENQWAVTHEKLRHPSLEGFKREPKAPSLHGNDGNSSQPSDQSPQKGEDPSYPNASEPFQFHTSQAEYQRAISKIQNHILDGDIYQANYTHLIETDLKNPSSMAGYELFSRLFRLNPSHYFAFLRFPEAEIMSTSPELFLSAQKGELEARPIKGTIGRSDASHPENEEAKINELLASEKDAAELSMIVDLFRNDLNRVCKPGSVEVTAHRAVLTMSNVFHLYSQIKGIQSEKADSTELLKACFPSGSITGCPKERSMQILDYLEKNERNVYTGSIGWIAERSLHLNVAIRTLIRQGSKLFYQVGGGIVLDSDPQAEYQESMDKAKTFLAVAGAGKKNE